jgi:hypothetical protein
MRSCDGCTKCCHGWLEGQAKGHKFYGGRPCFYIGKSGCSIYEDRPETPCKSYKCVWLGEEVLPEWFKPDLINAIVTKRELNGVPYYDVVEAGSTLQTKVLNWLVHWSLNDNINIVYRIDGGEHWLGSREFAEQKQRKKE